MTDKRIRKSKKALREALVELLREQPFDRITVTELCSRADVSRITFYAHYEDKYALADEISCEMLQTARENFDVLQRQNNQGRDPVVSYCNLLDCILKLYDCHNVFFRHVSAGRSSYLYHTFYRYLFENVEQRIDAESGSLPPKYSLCGIADFLCHGMWGFISRRFEERVPMPQIRAEAQELLRGLMSSGALMQCCWPAV